MTPKEEFRNTIECKPNSSVIPLWELEFHLWEKVSNKKFYVGEDFMKLSPIERDFALNENAEIIAKVSNEFLFNAVTIPGNYWEIAPGVPAYWWLPDEYRIKQAKILNNIFGKEIMLVANTGGVLAMPSSENYVDFAISLFETPEEIDELAEKIFQKGLESVNRFLDAGIQTFLTASDIADNRGPFFNPEQMERFILPYLERWAMHVKQVGGLSIFHSDGNLNLYLDKIVDTGVNAIQSIDPVAKMDIKEVKYKIGNKICLCGNIDIGKLITGSPSEIHIDVKDLVTFMHDKSGFVLGASNAIQQEVPLENYLALVQAHNNSINNK